MIGMASPVALPMWKRLALSCWPCAANESLRLRFQGTSHFFVAESLHPPDRQSYKKTVKRLCSHSSRAVQSSFATEYRAVASSEPEHWPLAVWRFQISCDSK